MTPRSDVDGIIEERRAQGTWPTERSLIADFAIQVAIQLEQERERQGLSYEQLAQKAGTSKAHVIRLLGGTYAGISNRSLAKLCHALNCEVDVQIRPIAGAREQLRSTPLDHAPKRAPILARTRAAG